MEFPDLLPAALSNKTLMGMVFALILAAVGVTAWWYMVLRGYSKQD